VHAVVCTRNKLLEKLSSEVDYTLQHGKESTIGDSILFDGLMSRLNLSKPVEKAYLDAKERVPGKKSFWAGYLGIFGYVRGFLL
jgi:hypothetical protein